MRWLISLMGVVGILFTMASGLAAEPVFVSSESAHLVVYYVRGTAAEKDLAQITANREVAYGIIKDALGVEPQKKLSVYLYPTRESTESGHGTGTARNDGSGVSVNYFSFVPSYERTRYGHELTHVIAYRLAGEHHGLPLLAEGLAELLDQSGRDMHEEVAACARTYGQRMQLWVEPESDFDYSRFKGGRCNYEKAGSFVKFLADAYGWDKFRGFYKATTEIARDFPEKRLEDFERQLQISYGIALGSLETNWNAAVSSHDRGTKRLAPEDEEAVRKLFAAQDSAAASHDSQAIADTYDFQAQQQISRFDSNLRYYADELERTDISGIYDLGIKNGASALVLAVRYFRDGQILHATYRLEKMESGWKIHSDNLPFVPAMRKSSQAKWDGAVSAYRNKNLPRLKPEDEKVIRKVFSLQDSAASSRDTASIEETYSSSARERISHFSGNLTYYAKQLKHTEIMAISPDKKNGGSATVYTVRDFKDGRQFRIRYRLEKTKTGWEICEEEWLN